MVKNKYMKNTIRMAREYGEGFVLADQSINTLDDIIIANVETLLSLGMGSPIDIQKAAKSLGLNPEQIDLLIRLPVGNAIGRKFGGKFPYAVHLRFPYRKPIYINDKEIDRINENNEIIKCILNKVVSNNPAIEKFAEKRIINQNNDKKHETEPKTKTNKNLIRLLTATLNNPYNMSTAILKDAGFSGSSGNNIKTFAINREYIKEHAIHLGKKGNAGKYFELTDKAYKFLDELYVEYVKPRGKGSFEHRLYQDILFKHFSQKGYRVTIEEANEKIESYTLVDISVEKPNGERISYEIEFNINQHIIHNIEKNIQAGYHEIVIVTKKNQKNAVLEFVENNLKPESKNRVEMKSIKEFL